MDISEIIGENLKQLRSERKLSLGRLSAQSGVSKVMLSQIEKGASNPSINTVWKIADALQLPYTALLERQMSGGTTISLKDIPSQKLDDDCGSLRCYYHHTNGRDFELFHMTPLMKFAQRSSFRYLMEGRENRFRSFNVALYIRTASSSLLLTAMRNEVKAVPTKENPPQRSEKLPKSVQTPGTSQTA